MDASSDHEVETAQVKHVTVPAMSWVVVCDGSKALLFQNVGDAQAINLKVADVQVEPHAPTRDLGAERSGRVYESLDGRRSSMEATNYHELAEVKFLGKVADTLDEVVRTRKVKHLVIVAPPKAMGVLRRQITEGVQKVVSAEIAKDLVKLPTAEIEHHLSVMGQLP